MYFGKQIEHLYLYPAVLFFTRLAMIGIYFEDAAKECGTILYLKPGWGKMDNAIQIDWLNSIIEGLQAVEIENRSHEDLIAVTKPMIANQNHNFLSWKNLTMTFVIQVGDRPSKNIVKFQNLTTFCEQKRCFLLFKNFCMKCKRKSDSHTWHFKIHLTRQ